MEAAWRKALGQVADSVDGGRLVVARDGTHYVQYDQPQAVIKAVRRVLAQARAAT